jgi:hypothetical protein
MTQGTVSRFVRTALAVAVLMGVVAATNVFGFVPRFYVKADASGTGDGLSWANAFTDLQSALDVATDPSLIYVAKGTYTPSSYNGLAPGDPADPRLQHFRLANGVAIYGGMAGNEDVFTFDFATRDFAANETILSGNIGAPETMTDNCYHVLYHYYADIVEYPTLAEYVNMAEPMTRTAVLDGFTVSDGNSTYWGTHGDGAGMHNNQASPTVRNCRFTSNVTARWGGGMYNTTSSSPCIEDCRFENNVAGVYGGAVANYGNSLATFARTVFAGNQATSVNPASGGAMANSVGSHVTLTDCEFRNNSAKEYGGAVYNWYYTSPTFHNCLFVGNEALSYSGGAISNIEVCHPVLRNCTVTSNWADGFAGNAGAMFSWKNSDPVCYNTIFWGNTATNHPEIYNHTHIDFDASTPDFRNCDIADSGGSGPGWDAALGTDSGGNLDADPLFRPSPGCNRNYRLLTASPCIDAGQNVSALTPTDLDGYNRFVDGNLDLTVTVDIGCYEYQTANLTLVASPPIGGSTTPTPGTHVVGVDIEISILATPVAGYLFTGWTVSGPGSLFGPPEEPALAVTIDEPSPVTVTANFAEAALLTVDVFPPDRGSTVPAAGVHTVAVGMPQAISATSVTGWHFTNWSVDAGNATLGDSLAAATTVTVADTGGATIAANFTINQYTVTFQTDGTAGATIDGGTVVTQAVNHGSDSTAVTAAAPGGFVFVNWTRDGVIYAGTAAVTATDVTADLTLVANFAPTGQTATLTLAAGANGATQPVPGGYTVEIGQGVGIVAVPDAGYEFFGWEVTAGNATLGNALSASTVVTATDAAGATVTARFGQYAVLTITADPDEGGTVGMGKGDPRKGDSLADAMVITVVVGQGVDISATGNFGFGFFGWTVENGDAVFGNSAVADTVVTVTTVVGATVVANFAEFDRLAVGSVFQVAANDVWLPGGFTAKPKVYGLYDHPFNGKVGLKAAAKVLTKVEKAGTPVVDSEWTKKIKLYDAKAFKADQKLGVSAIDWLVDPAHQSEIEMAIHVAGKELDPDDQALVAVILAAPQVLTATVGGDTLTLEGNWFGTKKPKVSREYEVEDGAGGMVVKQQKMKVLKPTEADALAGFVDSKGKPACMNPATGKSKVVAIVPAKEPKGTLNGILVIENGVGMGTATLP